MGKHRGSAPLKTKPAIGHDTKPVLSIPVLLIYPLLSYILRTIFYYLLDFLIGRLTIDTENN